MSGYSEAVDCPRCGSTESLEQSVDRDNISGCCLECGYSFKIVCTMMALEEVNEERAEFNDINMKPLTELKKPLDNWTDDS